MKKILFILHIPPPVHGSSLVGQSIMNSSLINNSFNCRYINLLVSRIMNETGKPSSMKVFRFVGVWFKLLLEVIKHKPDVCYLALTASGAAFFKDVLLVMLLRVFRIKRVYHLHNKGVGKNNNSTIYSFFYRFVFKNADIILLSNQLYSDIEAFVPTSHVYICPNGIEDIISNGKEQKVKHEKPVKIIFLSNLIKSKGVFTLLDACSILQQKGIEFECDFIGAEGDIDASQFSEAVNEKHLEIKVKYLGKKFGEEKQKIFTSAEIFAFPTSNDCFPLVLLEAMSAGLAVVSTFEGGIPDIIEDGITGFLLPENNAISLAEKLELLIKNPILRQQLGQAGRVRFENEFTIGKFEQRLDNILHSILIK